MKQRQAPGWASAIFNAAGFPPAVTVPVVPAPRRVVVTSRDDAPRSSKAARRIAMQTVAACPTCGALPGILCRSKSGAPAPWIHSPRTRASAIKRGDHNK